MERSERAVAWFSCGAASAVAAKLAVEKYGDSCVVVHCDMTAAAIFICALLLCGIALGLQGIGRHLADIANQLRDR